MGDGTVRGLRPGDALEPATTIHPDGTVTSPDGRRLGQMRADGMVVKPDGHILGMMTPNGAIVIPGPGDVLHPNSTVTPDGMALDAQGRPLGRVMPDGVVIGPDGAPIGMINADGFIGAMPPPGANLFTGTTLKQGKQFGPQIVLDSLGRVLGKLSGSGNNMVMGPDGQTSIGVRGPNGNIRYASMQDLDPSRGPPKNFSGKSHSMSAAQRDRARKFGPVPRCCGIPLGKLGQKFSNPLTWPALLLFSPVLIPLGVLFGMFKGCGLLGTGCKGFGRSCDKGCLDPACCGSCAPMCQPCFSACGFPDVAKNGLPRCEVGCARVVDTCKGGHCMEAMCTGCNCCSCFGCNAAAFSWPKCFQCVVQMSVGAGCLAPGRSLLALFVNTAALLWLFVYVLIEVIWNWGLSVDTCEHFGWFNASPSPDHWLLLTFAIVGIVIVALFFMYNVFGAPPSRRRTRRSRAEARSAPTRASSCSSSPLAASCSTSPSRARSWARRPPRSAAWPGSSSSCGAPPASSACCSCSSSAATAPSAAASASSSCSRTSSPPLRALPAPRRALPAPRRAPQRWGSHRSSSVPAKRTWAACTGMAATLIACQTGGRPMGATQWGLMGGPSAPRGR